MACCTRSVALASEEVVVDDFGFTSSGGGDLDTASSANNDGLGVREHGSNVLALLALDIHEERVRVLNESLQFVLGLLELEIVV